MVDFKNCSFETTCARIREIDMITEGGWNRVEVKLEGANVEKILISLCENYGEDEVINYIKNL